MVHNKGRPENMRWRVGDAVVDSFAGRAAKGGKGFVELFEGRLDGRA
jgi:hypothetical protein